MRNLIILAAFVFASATSFAQVSAAAGSEGSSSAMAVFEWDAASHDFGKIKQGVPVTHEFKFTNTGKTPLVITNVQASCGCTTPDWSKEPIPPGGQGFIKATYNAAAIGAFNKSVTVMANVDQGFKQLSIKGEVVVQE
ncbi:MAG TPA: DUF1573 domain-containing protein [Cyclobacteriaceae bacterium]|nr:DUF1573 domain-containing protein [Cyclobacteriaceae bacterium]